ncbi:unnamed protein product [Phytophthora fragariaefolia]|uniref:Unnamed protein product n=1 Tax=Phytophthora fragariaefolia TaxID=1490495 RepID=A0A9W6TXQ5_9STRA|nr:unnamed protein product [Phytophthora fragariaefolia]
MTKIRAVLTVSDDGVDGRCDESAFELIPSSQTDLIDDGLKKKNDVPIFTLKSSQANKDDGDAAQVIELDSSDTENNDETHCGIVAATSELREISSVAAHNFFRKRYPRNSVVVEWRDIHENRTLHVLRDDLYSLLSGESTTESALDYFIYRYIQRKDGVVSACGTSMFQEIELVSSGCRNPAKKKKALRKAINDFDWGAYRFVLL